MGTAHGFTFAAAQTVFDGVGNFTQLGLFHNQGFYAQQLK
ncbi:hypothetical protein SASC598O11_002850 [Snodgrassella alvi SCGC AB-598-O11]|nr:hypothetical protein SASC598O11_002850 [Snodgrassella alvi SCGC AB-598-O11]